MVLIGLASLTICFTNSFVNLASWYFPPLHFQSVRSATLTYSSLSILPIALLQSCTGILAGLTPIIVAAELAAGLGVGLVFQPPLVTLLRDVGVGCGWRKSSRARMRWRMWCWLGRWGRGRGRS